MSTIIPINHKSANGVVLPDTVELNEKQTMLFSIILNGFGGLIPCKITVDSEPIIKKENESEYEVYGVTEQIVVPDRFKDENYDYTFSDEDMENIKLCFEASGLTFSYKKYTELSFYVVSTKDYYSYIKLKSMFGYDFDDLISKSFVVYDGKDDNKKHSKKSVKNEDSNEQKED